ncbi:DUF4350 domain-containing protein [Candidatus Oscillochloris fontis]|uniref:DUF4350 domain-containing protein n=1 Tax=Candidatus Oscillochloris fontis TaxID=2496868 RepID=UPI00101B7A6C|nr:DUF4350 domain-containing protein [Candidatus Oscillochloris fontis]
MILRYRREILIISALFGGLLIFLLIVPNDEGGGSHQATSHSSNPRGTMALYRWLGELGYQVERLEYRDFTLDATSDLLVVLEPPEVFTPDESAAVVAWVEVGGTLILADERHLSGSAPLFQAFAARLGSAANSMDTQARIVQPVAPVSQLQMQNSSVLAQLPAAAAVLVEMNGEPVVAGFVHGKGYVYLSSSTYPFSNVGLAQAGSAELVLHLVGRIGPSGRILFDEYHHGFVREPSLGSLLTGSAWGWAMLYAGGVVVLYLVLSGRRFGRPIALREERTRRSSAEYLESMAGLLRRGRKSDYLLAHYRTNLKRRLARPYGVNPNQDDTAFVAALAGVSPIDPNALRSLLARMDRPEVSESELLRLIAEADRF